jgi:hypothetical protein
LGYDGAVESSGCAVHRTGIPATPVPGTGPSPHLRFRPQVDETPRVWPSQGDHTNIGHYQRLSAYLIWAAALIAYLMGLLYIFSFQRLALEPWFMVWAGRYAIVAFVMGMFGGACAYRGVRLRLVVVTSLALVLAGLLDFNGDGTGIMGLGIIMFAGLGMAIASNISYEESRAREAPLHPPVAAGMVISHEADLSTVRPASALRGKRKVAANLLGLASFLALVSGVAGILFSLWYHPYEAYLEVEWGLLALGVGQVLVAAFGFYGTYLVIRNRHPALQISASAAVLLGNTVMNVGWYLEMCLMTVIPMVLGFITVFLVILVNTDWSK